jgi:cbb3-type cytochrome oxidase subunit 3
MDLTQLLGYLLTIFITGFEKVFGQIYSMLGLSGVVGFFVGYFLSDKMQTIKTWLLVVVIVVFAAVLYFGYTETQATQAAAAAVSNLPFDASALQNFSNDTTFIPYP